MFRPYKGVFRQCSSVETAALQQFVCQCIPCYCVSSSALKCVSLRINTLSSLRVIFILWCPCCVPPSYVVLISRPRGGLHRKHRLLYCCALIQDCRNTFTAPLRSNAPLSLRAFACAGMCLSTRCLTVNYSGFQASCHNMDLFGVSEGKICPPDSKQVKLIMTSEQQKLCSYRGGVFTEDVA
jgi:hypothetical protein